MRRSPVSWQQFFPFEVNRGLSPADRGLRPCKACPVWHPDHMREDGLLIDSIPIPETKDGFLYCCEPGRCGDYLTIDEAKTAADAQPWGPVTWD
jgi:hypothetical protein